MQYTGLLSTLTAEMHKKSRKHFPISTNLQSPTICFICPRRNSTRTHTLEVQSECMPHPPHWDAGGWPYIDAVNPTSPRKKTPSQRTSVNHFPTYRGWWWSSGYQTGLTIEHKTPFTTHIQEEELTANMVSCTEKHTHKKL